MPHRGALYPFQVEGTGQLVARRSVLLADDMGLGKTIQAASAMRELFDMGAVERVLIVCPASLCRNWRQEVQVWGGVSAVLYEGSSRHGMLEGGAKVLIGSYEVIAADLGSITKGGTMYAEIGLDLLVLDEAQRIKAPTSARARCLSHLMAPRRWAITGTPLENHPRELASILRFLHPNEFGTADTLDDYRGIMRYRDLCMVRRTKDQVDIQLPSCTVSYTPVGMTPEQLAEYEQARDVVRSDVLHASSRQVAVTSLLGGLQRLRRVAAISSSGASAKVDLIEDELEGIVASGGKAIVFSSFANLALPVVARRLERFGSVLFTGAMTGAERHMAHTRFLEDDDARVMCASTQAAGVGITWTVAQYVFHLDLWWNPQVLRQAEDRAHRIGQVRPVNVKRLVAEGTVDEGIVRLLAAKEGIFDLLIGGGQDARGQDPDLSSLLQLVGLRLGDVTAGDS